MVVRWRPQLTEQESDSTREQERDGVDMGRDREVRGGKERWKRKKDTMK